MFFASRIRLITSLSFVIVVAYSAVVVTSKGHAEPSLPPGVSAGVHIFDTRATAPVIDARTRSAIELTARAGNTDIDRALGEVRLLRRSLASDGSSLYGFRSESGSPCVILIGHAGFCAPSPATGTPGLQWAMGGATLNSPGSLVGIASDDVTSVSLAIDGADVPVSLADNVVYAEFPNGEGNAAVKVSRADGRSNSFTLSLGG